MNLNIQSKQFRLTSASAIFFDSGFNTCASTFNFSFGFFGVDSKLKCKGFFSQTLITFKTIFESLGFENDCSNFKTAKIILLTHRQIQKYLFQLMATFFYCLCHSLKCFNAKREKKGDVKSLSHISKHESKKVAKTGN